jgi:hypothetical protein
MQCPVAYTIVVKEEMGRIPKKRTRLLGLIFAAMLLVSLVDEF